MIVGLTRKVVKIDMNTIKDVFGKKLLDGANFLSKEMLANHKFMDT
jgi:hypothetical protein